MSGEKLRNDCFPPHINDLLSVGLGAVCFLVDFQALGNSQLRSSPSVSWLQHHRLLLSLSPDFYRSSCFLFHITTWTSHRHLRPNESRTSVPGSRPANLSFRLSLPSRQMSAPSPTPFREAPNLGIILPLTTYSQSLSKMVGSNFTEHPSRI